MTEFTAPTRYEMLIAASRELQNQSFLLAREGDQSRELLCRCLLDFQDLQADIHEFEAQMLDLWRRDCNETEIVAE